MQLEFNFTEQGFDGVIKLTCTHCEKRTRTWGYCADTAYLIFCSAECGRNISPHTPRWMATTIKRPNRECDRDPRRTL